MNTASPDQCRQELSQLLEVQLGKIDEVNAYLVTLKTSIAQNDIEAMKDKIEADLPHHANEVICVKCLHRNIAIYPVGTALKILECDECHEQGYIILTGEDV